MISLMGIVSQARPRKLLEIGTSNGGTLFLFARVAAHDATIIGIDLPRKHHPTGIPKWRLPLYKAFASRGQSVRMITHDSHSPATLAKVKAILRGQEVDFLFIDGDHSYEGVESDFRMYSPLVRRGGLIAFHDIVPDYKTRYGSETFNYAGGVHLLWSVIKTKHRFQEVVANQGQDAFGIGILTK
jgi:predicted O-methyltransferase YrrM